MGASRSIRSVFVKICGVTSEEDALRLWAAMPDKNPLNSALAANPLAFDYLARDFALTQRYRWPMLGDGQCPNQGRFADADLRVSLWSEPPGLGLGFLEHDLPGLDALAEYRFLLSAKRRYN
mgnify:CR=1 FL=1